MTKTEYNELLDQRFKETLKSRGFKKSGIHYYLYEAPIVLFVRNGWKYSDEILLCYSFDYLDKFKDEKGKFNVPKGMLNYPIVVSAHVLRQQYKSHKSAYRFKYDLCFYTKSSISPLDFGLFLNFFKTPKKTTLEYIDYSLDVIQNEGMRLMKETNSDLAYWVLSKYPDKKYALPLIMKVKEQVKAHLMKNNLPVRRRQNSFIENIQIFHYYYRLSFRKWKQKLKAKIYNRKKPLATTFIISALIWGYSGFTMLSEYRKNLKINGIRDESLGSYSISMIVLSIIIFIAAYDIWRMKKPYVF